MENGRGSALLRFPRPRGAGGTNGARFHAPPHSLRRQALRSATRTAQRAIPTSFWNSGLKSGHPWWPYRPLRLVYLIPR